MDADFPRWKIKKPTRKNGSVSLLLAEDYTPEGFATRFRLRVQASQNGNYVVKDVTRASGVDSEKGLIYLLSL